MSKLLAKEDTLTFDKACQIVLDLESAKSSAADIVSNNSASSSSASNTVESEVNAVNGFHKSTHHRRSPYKSHKLSESNHLLFGRKHKFSSSSTRNKSCRECYSKHKPADCPVKSWTCYSCGQKGHTSRFCRTKTANYIHYGCHAVEYQADVSPLVVNTLVNGHKLNFIVDTGSFFSIIPIDIFKKYFSNELLSRFNGRLSAANQLLLKVLGKMSVNVTD
ncbi:hypothetical protein ILUMI_13513 [Ignelater luminosus]|uniref:CCHC-type domain-containing protein n=1 Tax=Ignelater luminosus TaxID=2038154 RepID=A0A8K0GBW6_IGNLU|nr:hypothetical protein ILUMI_13513 [Ignelater luminosus]